MMSLLIKSGFGSYKELMEMPIYRILQFNKWFVDDYKEEQKNKLDYDLAFAKIGCPLLRSKKR